MSIGEEQPTITIIGGGLAGVEAAWQAARAGAQVDLWEMRPVRQTPAHQTDLLAELVCSNSLKSEDPATAQGLLKQEMRLLGSLLLEVADECRVPSGTALAVDRAQFARLATERIMHALGVAIHREEVTRVPEAGVCIVASGPLTSDGLAESLAQATGKRNLYFYDALSPIIEAESINMERTYEGLRYDKGEGLYLNCPMTQEEYDRFWEALTQAEMVALRPFEERTYFEGCLPIEEIARRGKQALAFGPLRPVGLPEPESGRRPFAVVQLRPENRQATLFNMVGFQTALKQGEQKQVFRMIPGLEKAEFARYGCIHRNTYINAPAALDTYARLRGEPRVFIAGQLCGVEGYLESAASGLLAGMNGARQVLGQPLFLPPEETMVGALLRHVTASDPRTFQPVNAMYGLLPPLAGKFRDRTHRRLALGERALEALRASSAPSSLA